jgi:hypothetical protein
MYGWWLDIMPSFLEYLLIVGSIHIWGLGTPLWASIIITLSFLVLGTFVRLVIYGGQVGWAQKRYGAEISPHTTAALKKILLFYDNNVFFFSRTLAKLEKLAETNRIRAQEEKELREASTRNLLRPSIQVLLLHSKNRGSTGRNVTSLLQLLGVDLYQSAILLKEAEVAIGVEATPKQLLN